MRTKDTTLVGIANLLGRVTGMIAEIVMSAVFGASKVTDAYYAAFRVPQILRELLAEGTLQNAFVPAFSEAAEREGLQGAWRLANAFLGVLMVVLGAVTLMFFLGAPFFVTLVASGFGADAEKYALTVQLTRWMSPFLAGLSIAGFIAAMLNVRGRFFGPALAQNVFNGLIILGCLGGPTFERMTGIPSIFALALATTLSGFVQVAVTLPGLLREGYVPRPTLGGHPALRKMLTFFGPAIIGIATVQVNFLIESNWASAYGDGPVTWLMKSFRLVQIPLAVFAGSVATTALAALSLHAARREERELGDTLARALRLNSFLVLPTAVALGILADPLVKLLFERGAFDAQATAGTALMLRMYAWAVFGICFHRIAVPVYYALGDPKTPMWNSIGAMLAKVPVVLLLTRGFGMGVEALPFSHAIIATGQSVQLLGGLRGRVAGRGLVGAHLRMAVASVVLGGVAWGLRDQVHVVITCAVAGVSYLVVARVLGVEELSGLGRMKRPALPPSVDDTTRAALEALARGGWAVDGDRIRCAAGSWRVSANGDDLVLVPEGEAGVGEGTGPVLAVLRPGRPPTLKGIVLGPHAWHVEAGKLKTGDSAGPHVPVPPQG